MALLTPEDKQILVRIQRILDDEMPFYVHDFHLFKENTGFSRNTMLNYLYHYRQFFKWLIKHNVVNGPTTNDITLQELNDLSLNAVSRFLSHFKNESLPLKTKQSTDDAADATSSTKEEPLTNRIREKNSVAQMLLALKSLFNYLEKKAEFEDTRQPYIQRNVMGRIDTDFEKESVGVRSEKIAAEIIPSKDIVSFLDFVANDYEKDLTKRQRSPFYRDYYRDLAILHLFLGTGIRLRELCSLLTEDVNLEERTIKIVRKGGKKDTALLMDSVAAALKDFADARRSIYPKADECPFFFVSLHSGKAKPISRRAVQYLVEKYTKAFFQTKGILPHKLRHSFAIDFMRTENDLVKLRDMLGHSDISVTSLYLSSIKEENFDALRRVEEQRYQDE